MDRTPGPNWLLRTLLVFSVGVHALLLVHLSGIYQSDPLTVIEMSLQNIIRPTARDIPRPRPRPKAPAPRVPVKKLDVVQHPLPQFKPLAMKPVESSLPESVVETISAPDVPRTPRMEAADWAMGSQVQEVAGEYITGAGYLDMVRLKIEGQKRYPEAATAERIEGRVTIRFILSSDGSVRDVVVVKGARHGTLNMAAMDAVKQAAPFPRLPPNLFEGDLSLELTIVFELT